MNFLHIRNVVYPYIQHDTNDQMDFVAVLQSTKMVLEKSIEDSFRACISYFAIYGAMYWDES